MIFKHCDLFDAFLAIFRVYCWDVRYVYYSVTTVTPWQTPWQSLWNSSNLIRFTPEDWHCKEMHFFRWENSSMLWSFTIVVTVYVMVLIMIFELESKRLQLQLIIAWKMSELSGKFRQNAGFQLGRLSPDIPRKIKTWTFLLPMLIRSRMTYPDLR